MFDTKLNATFYCDDAMTLGFIKAVLGEISLEEADPSRQMLFIMKDLVNKMIKTVPK